MADAAGERVARRDGPTGTGGVFYYFSDHLKTASVITDSAGVIKAESDYYPWGGELQFVANDSNHYKFTSKERDGETGLDYFGARYYSNGLGRWVSADWSAKPAPVPYADFHDPQTLNLYGYVKGNPSSKSDPDGHENLKPQDWPDDRPKPAPSSQPTPQPQSSAQNQKQPEKPQAKHGLTIGIGVAGNAEAGVGPVGAQVSGSAIVAASISSSGKPSIGVAATGSAVDATPAGVIAAPKQETAPLIAGAYGGGGVTLV